MLRTVIVEDEEASRERLRRLLNKHAERLVVVGEADSGPAAVVAIESYAPDLVLLDISLPGFDGFEVLRSCTASPAVIFTTAYDEFAVQAFRVSAVDYLLKPIDEAQLADAIARCETLHPRRSSYELDKLIALVRTLREGEMRRIACRVGDATVFVSLRDVQYFQADEGYTLVKTEDKELLIDTSLIDLESRLSQSDFVRIHRGTLVNMAHVASFKRALDGRVRVALKDGSELAASRRYSENLRNMG